MQSRKPKPTTTDQVCRFCGCTESRPCANGCAWYDARTCTVCAKTLHLGQVHAITKLIEAFSDAPPEIDTVQLINELRETAAALSEEILRLEAPARAKQAIHDDAAPQEFGKGRRSSDSMTAGAGA